ncbi:Alpha/Beta hydrolase protein [Xylogone sp. PMI_703]|nr:Alpha/Beta hydrolase protein [Xylogone sp. PMI_703]
MTKLESDITINAWKFDPASIAPTTTAFTDQLIKVNRNRPRWYNLTYLEIGAIRYREMRLNGEPPFQKSQYVPQARDFWIPSRDTTRKIPCRILLPTNNAVNGVFLHIHGGGWVVQTEKDQDFYLENLAETSSLLVVSVGYRLAPEHPFPKGLEDCFDVAEWLIDNAKQTFGGSMKFLGSESAGAHYTALTAIHLLKHRSEFSFQGLVLNYGIYDLSFLPRVRTFTQGALLGLDEETLEHCVQALLPGLMGDRRKAPHISPLYVDIAALPTLPSALFICGTADCLLDDTMAMGSSWMMSQADTVVKIFPGAPHGFVIKSAEDAPLTTDINCATVS